MTLYKTLLQSNAGIAQLLLRLPVGIIFMAHGSQKLFGWFGGYGLHGTAKFMASVGLEPGLLMATLSGSAEFFGGLLLFLGLLTRPAAFFTGFTMLVAIFSVHISHGLFLSNGGFEYALALLAVCASLIVSGSGCLAIDRYLTK
ncbi:DoxX family protein [Celerinatantimonas diazotrophica]|uniref:Putative oxidoreductase n=1 Tax=Celerinatantimonas diazotrophica TaxID=412034 RepID=A0A4R1K3M5_9GAMM|nr:DoxX family protein [Celerinatantimonas diazotrophica]TCK58698.1 putative oxidoreductase [Celerinatantimonas diazotrophica]CAG9297327.1 Putative oxidoreductase MhqP [Celerinatantimonas diazotrophica]